MLLSSSDCTLTIVAAISIKPYFYEGFAEVGAGGRGVGNWGRGRGEWKQRWLERRWARPISGQIRAGRKRSAAQCIMENTPISVAQACPSQPAPGPLALCPSSAFSWLLKGLDQWHKSLCQHSHSWSPGTKSPATGSPGGRSELKDPPPSCIYQKIYFY